MNDDGAMVSLLKAVEVASKTDTAKSTEDDGKSPDSNNENRSNPVSSTPVSSHHRPRTNRADAFVTPNRRDQSDIPQTPTISGPQSIPISQSLSARSLPSPLPTTNSLTPIPHLTPITTRNSTSHSIDYNLTTISRQNNSHNNRTKSAALFDTPKGKPSGNRDNRVKHHVSQANLRPDVKNRGNSVDNPLMNPPKLAPIRQLASHNTPITTNNNHHHAINPNQTFPPPPPPLPPPLPSPPPLPPMSLRRLSDTPSTSMNGQQIQPSPVGFVEKRKGARVFSSSEKKLLEANYSQNKFPSRLHMETLGKALGKGTDKVRTWYNNRRALDRKLGVDVHRNHIEDVNSPARFSREYAARQMEETVILPSNVIATPLETLSRNTSQEAALQNTITSPVKTEDGKVVVTVACASDGQSYGSEKKLAEPYVAVSPSAITWAPAASPISVERRHPSIASSSQIESCSRFRIPPFHVRNVRLMIGDNMIYGEMPEDPTMDTGLEVKFLFGKKRFVYEWYCGEDYMQAQSTGGPYAKMEMNFSNVYNMRLCQGTAKSVIMLSFSASPGLFLQTAESMNKYKIRSQQRQYRKVEQKEFPISVASDHHKIMMRTDEAMRVSKMLIEDTPRLGSVFETISDPAVLSQMGFPCQLNQTPSLAVVNREHEMHGMSSQQFAVVPHRERSPDGTHVKLPVAEPPASNGAMVRSNIAESRNVNATPNGKGSTPFNERSIVCPTTATRAAANLQATPAHWQSPQTPFMSTVSRLPNGSSIPWLTSAVPPSVSSTPFEERISHETPGYSTHVRRELNFSNTQGFGRDPSTPATNHLKRTIHDAIGEENDETDRSRPRLSTFESKTPLRDLRFRVPDPPAPPQLPGVDVKDTGKKKNQEEATKNQNEVDSAVLRNLPR